MERLGNRTVKIQDGTHFSPKSTEGPCRYLTSKNVRFGYLDIEDSGWISKEEHRAIYSRCDVRQGDVLLTKDGANTGNATINTLEEEFSLLSSVALIRCDEQTLLGRYVLQYLLSSEGQRRLKDGMSGNAITRLTLEKIKAFEIPVPPPNQQRRIADILDAADAAIRQTDAVIAKLRQMKAGLLYDLLTRGLDEQGRLRDPAAHPEEFKDSQLGRIPKEWAIKNLREVSGIGSGVTLGRDVQGATAVELPYLRVANVQDGHIDLSEIKSVLVFRSEVPRYLLQAGDVLMTEGGDFDKLGRGAVWRGAITPCLHQNHIFRVRANRDHLLPDFLAAVSASQIGKKYFLRSSKQTTNLASINSTQLKAFPVPCPPLDEQHRIAAAMQGLDDHLENEEAYRDKLKLQKRGLMHDLLTGRVRV
jgi:type I restriction enzyme S subunit